MKKELLDILSEKTGCMYLSDLKFMSDTSSIKTVIKRLNPQDFSLKEWYDAVNYLTEQTVSFSSEIEAKNFLLEAKIVTK